MGIFGGRPLSGKGKVRAFTLVELLVVVGIIALLVTILMPSLGRALELTRRTKCAANLHVMGRGFVVYWQDNNDKTPGYQRGIGQPGDFAADVSANMFYLAYYANTRHYVGAGVLAKQKYLQQQEVFICPTIDSNTGKPWFSDTAGAFMPRYGPNPWPPSGSRHTRICYGMRRMRYYSDPSLADVDRAHKSSPLTDDIMLCKFGVGNILNAASFSFMADAFHMPEIAEMSHVPGVNVLYIDSHVEFFRDDTPDGEILYYGNGTDGTNWPIDVIWMRIDGTRDKGPF